MHGAEEMKGRNEEKGFVLLEVVLLSMIILAMVANIAVFEKANTVKIVNGTRTKAIYMVQEEFAYLEEKAALRNLQAGTYAWLGKSDRLQENQEKFSVQAEVSAETADVYHANVKATWQNGKHQGTVTMEREIVSHQGEVKYDKS